MPSVIDDQDWGSVLDLPSKEEPQPEMSIREWADHALQADADKWDKIYGKEDRGILADIKETIAIPMGGALQSLGQRVGLLEGDPEETQQRIDEQMAEMQEGKSYLRNTFTQAMASIGEAMFLGGLARPMKAIKGLSLLQKAAAVKRNQGLHNIALGYGAKTYTETFNRTDDHAYSFKQAMWETLPMYAGSAIMPPGFEEIFTTTGSKAPGLIKGILKFNRGMLGELPEEYVTAYGQNWQSAYNGYGDEAHKNPLQTFKDVSLSVALAMGVPIAVTSTAESFLEKSSRKTANEVGLPEEIVSGEGAKARRDKIAETAKELINNPPQESTDVPPSPDATETQAPTETQAETPTETQAGEQVLAEPVTEPTEPPITPVDPESVITPEVAEVTPEPSVEPEVALGGNEERQPTRNESMDAQAERVENTPYRSAYDGTVGRFEREAKEGGMVPKALEYAHKVISTEVALSPAEEAAIGFRTRELENELGDILAVDPVDETEERENAIRYSQIQEDIATLDQAAKTSGSIESAAFRMRQAKHPRTLAGLIARAKGLKMSELTEIQKKKITEPWRKRVEKMEELVTVMEEENRWVADAALKVKTGAKVDIKSVYGNIAKMLKEGCQL